MLFRDSGALIGGSLDAGVVEIRVGPDFVKEAGGRAGRGDEPDGASGGGDGWGEGGEDGVGDEGGLLEEEEVGGVAAVGVGGSWEGEDAGAVGEGD